jgi:hypothetical protein
MKFVAQALAAQGVKALRVFSADHPSRLLHCEVTPDHGRRDGGRTPTTALASSMVE